MRADLQRPVDLASGDQLATSALFRIGEHRWWWYQRIHHVAIDGYGFSILLRRVAEVYSALAAGEQPQPNPFGPLRSLLEAERSYRESEKCEKDEKFWHDQLADWPDAGSLAGRIQRTARGFRRQTGELPGSTVRLLEAAAGQSRTAWTDALVAAFGAYLHRMTGSRDVVLGLPVMGRRGSALRVPGMVVNVLPLRLRIAPGTTRGELVAQVAREIRQLRKHQHYRGEDLRRQLRGGGTDRRCSAPWSTSSPSTTTCAWPSPATVHNVATSGRRPDPHLHHRADLQLSSTTPGVRGR